MGWCEMVVMLGGYFWDELGSLLDGYVMVWVLVNNGCFLWMVLCELMVIIFVLIFNGVECVYNLMVLMMLLYLLCGGDYDWWVIFYFNGVGIIELNMMDVNVLCGVLLLYDWIWEDDNW